VDLVHRARSIIRENIMGVSTHHRDADVAGLNELGLEEVERRLATSPVLPVAPPPAVAFVPPQLPCCVCDPWEPWYEGGEEPPA
jgi:hypothetical protein